MFGSDSFASSDDECDTVCLPRGDHRPTASFVHSFPHPSTSFNCSLDFLSGHHSKFCLDLNVDMCSAYCTCHGSGVCGFCSFSPPEVLSSSFNLGSFSLNVSSRLSFRRRGFRDHSREERLTSLRGIVKHPKLYRAKKMHNISEALIYSISSASGSVPRSPRWMSSHRSLARTRKMHMGRSRIPVPTTSLNTILEVVEHEDIFSSPHATDDQFGLQHLNIKEEAVDVKPVVETPAVSVNYEDDLCSRMNVMHPSHNELDEGMVAQLQHGLETCTLSTDI